MSTLYVDNIYSKTGASQALDIDSSGRILTPNRPMFKVFRTANTNYSTNDVKMTGWDDDTTAGSINVNNFWDTTNDKATIPVTGLYMFEIRGYWLQGTYGQFGIGMYVNASNTRGADFRVNRENGSYLGYTSVNFVAHLYLNANDYVEFYFIQRAGTAEFHPSSGNIYSGACGHLIG